MNCTWEYKLGIKFIRDEGEGASYSCNIGQEIARGKAFSNPRKMYQVILCGEFENIKNKFRNLTLTQLASDDIEDVESTSMKINVAI